MDRKDPKVVPVDFDNRQYEVTLDCVLTYRGYAPFANDFLDSVLANLANCINMYNERLVEIKKVEAGRVREGMPTESGKSVLRD